MSLSNPLVVVSNLEQVPSSLPQFSQLDESAFSIFLQTVVDICVQMISNQSMSEHFVSLLNIQPDMLVL